MVPSVRGASKLVTLSTKHARFASWALDIHLRKKRKALVILKDEAMKDASPADFNGEITETEDDIALYQAAYDEIRRQL
jgi:hypothetical protein